MELENAEHYLSDKGREEKRTLFKYCKKNFTRVKTFEDAMKGATSMPENTFIDGCPLRNGKYGPAIKIFISDTLKNSGDTYYPIHCIQRQEIFDTIYEAVTTDKSIDLPKPNDDFSVFEEVEDEE